MPPLVATATPLLNTPPAATAMEIDDDTAPDTDAMDVCAAATSSAHVEEAEAEEGDMEVDQEAKGFTDAAQWFTARCARFGLVSEALLHERWPRDMPQWLQDVFKGHELLRPPPSKSVSNFQRVLAVTNTGSGKAIILNRLLPPFDEQLQQVSYLMPAEVVASISVAAGGSVALATSAASAGVNCRVDSCRSSGGESPPLPWSRLPRRHRLSASLRTSSL